MRIKLISTFILIVTFSAAFSQTIYINPGFTFSKLNWVIYPGLSNISFYEKPLFSYGVTAGIEYLHRKNFSLASEVLFYESGGIESGEDKHSGYSEAEDHKARMRYLSLGTYFNFNPLDRTFKIQIQLGPRIDYIVGGYDQDPWKGYMNSRKIERFQYGFNVGLGGYYNMEKFVFGLNVKYMHKLSKIVDYQPDRWDGDFAVPVEISDQVLLVTVSVGYKLK
jgi:hypothetical protein